MAVLVGILALSACSPRETVGDQWWGIPRSSWQPKGHLPWSRCHLGSL